ncbi:MAG: proton-conducting transporter membrane subunit [Roseiflexaceae bacterium]
MFAFIFALPLIAALLCMALNHIVPTRWLGIGAAGALLLAVGALLAPSPTPLSVQTWAVPGEQPVSLVLAFDMTSRPFALLALGGGALALLALALALPRDLRGFGGLIAALLLVSLAVVIGMANQEPVLLPFAWALAALLGFAALRASGTIGGAGALPVGLLAGLVSALLLVGATLAPDATASGPAALVCWTLVELLTLGAPPFHAVFDEPAEAPAALVGPLLALGLPLLGGYTLLHFAATQWATAPLTWRMAWTLLGLLAVLACAAGAIGTTRVRRLIGWQLSAQFGLVLISIGLGGDQPPLALAAGLLVNAAVTTLACYLAMIVLERRAGTDDLEIIGAHGPLLLPGLAFLLAAASAVGCLGTWGWWVQSELFERARSTAPWLIAPLLAGDVLRALAYVAPLAAFWRMAEARPLVGVSPRRGWPTLVAMLCPAVAVLPLLAWGVAPELAWEGWLAGFQRAGATPPLPGALARFGSGLAALALIGLPLLATRGRTRRAPVDQDVRNTALLIPQALGYSLRGLIGLGAPDELFRAIWAGLLNFSRAAARLLSLFEQRYYLAGLMIAVIIVIMLMI